MSNFGLPPGYTPHNPDNITPEQLGEGYRLLSTVEIGEGCHLLEDSWYFWGPERGWSEKGRWFAGRDATTRVLSSRPVIPFSQVSPPHVAALLVSIGGKEVRLTLEEAINLRDSLIETLGVGEDELDVPYEVIASDSQWARKGPSAGIMKYAGSHIKVTDYKGLPQDPLSSQSSCTNKL